MPSDDGGATTPAGRSQLVAGSIIVPIAVVDLAVTFVDHDALPLRALPFAGSRFALLPIGR